MQRSALSSSAPSLPSTPTVASTPTPEPSPSPTPVVVSQPTATITVTPITVASPTPDPTPTPFVTPVVSPTPQPTPDLTPTIVPQVSTTVTAQPTVTPTLASDQTMTPRVNPTPTPTTDLIPQQENVVSANDRRNSIVMSLRREAGSRRSSLVAVVAANSSPEEVKSMENTISLLEEEIIRRKNWWSRGDKNPISEMSDEEIALNYIKANRVVDVPDKNYMTKSLELSKQDLPFSQISDEELNKNITRVEHAINIWAGIEDNLLLKECRRIKNGLYQELYRREGNSKIPKQMSLDSLEEAKVKADEAGEGRESTANADYLLELPASSQMPRKPNAATITFREGGAKELTDHSFIKVETPTQKLVSDISRGAYSGEIKGPIPKNSIIQLRPGTDYSASPTAGWNSYYDIHEIKE